MKKIFVLITTITLMFSLIACSNSNQSGSGTSENSVYSKYGSLTKMEDYLSVNEVGGFYKIDSNDFEKLIKNKESFAILIGYPGCSWCHKGMPVVNDMLLENNLSVFYMDISAQDENGFNLINDFVSTHLKEKYNDEGFYTPMMLAVKNGEISDSVLGGIDSTGSEYSDDEAKQLTEKYLGIFSIVR